MGPDEEQMLEAVGVMQLRRNMRRILDTAHYVGRRYLILRDGVSVAVLLGLEDYRRLTAAAEGRRKMEEGKGGAE